MSVIWYKEWTLKEQFIVSQIDKLNHPDYFSSELQCPDIQAFVCQVRSNLEVSRNRDLLNKIFDNLIASKCTDRAIFVRLKWLTFLHRLIHCISQNHTMLVCILKALQIYTQKIDQMCQQFDHYSKYLTNKILKQYLQHLSKICLIYLPNKFVCEQNAQISNTKSASQKIQQNKVQKNEKATLNWYRRYNFVVCSLQSFSKILSEQQPFFMAQVPYLLNIRKLITQDLRANIKYLKQKYTSFELLSITAMQIDKIGTRVQQFAKNNDNIFALSESLMTSVQDYTQQDITNFMCTPLKQKETILSQTKCSVFN